MVFLTTLFLISLQICVNALGPLVKTEQGIVEGLVQRTSKRQSVYFSFEGVPYAQAPINNLRFEAPIYPKPYNYVWDARRKASNCFTIDINNRIDGDEDCLYLNIYTPYLPQKNYTNILKPILVWISHFELEVQSNYKENFNPEIFLELGVIVVTINYRLGIFGFFSTGDLVVPGNNGLKDQLIALRWIKNNIACFGGNSNQITIAGQDTGATSILINLLNGKSTGLFRAAIIHSNSNIVPLSLQMYPQQNAFRTGRFINIYVNNTKELVRCLKQENPIKLLLLNKVLPFTFTIETENLNSVLTSKPLSYYRTKQVQNISVVFGYVPMKITRLVSELSEKELYGNSLNFGEQPRSINNDLKPLDTIKKAAQYHARYINNNTFLYRYDYNYENDRIPEIFSCENSTNISPITKRVNNKLIRLLVNFIKYLNPTPVFSSYFDYVEWTNIYATGFTNELYFLSVNVKLQMKALYFGRKLELGDQTYFYKFAKN